MKFRLMSDLHLRHHPYFRLAKINDDEHLILCGDDDLVLEAEHYFLKLMERVITGAEFRTPEHVRLFKNQQLTYVYGNHDLSGRNIFKSDWQKYTSMGMPYTRLKFIDDIAIISLPLFTDFNQMQYQSMKECVLSFNDFRELFNNWNNNASPFDMIALHMQYLKFIHDVHSMDVSKIVIASHFAPSFKSLPNDMPFYLKYWFASDLDYFIMGHPKIKLWCHGHVHTSCDYQIGQCRVVCNPLGFKPDDGFDLFQVDNSRDFNQNLVVEV